MWPNFCSLKVMKSRKPFGGLASLIHSVSTKSIRNQILLLPNSWYVTAICPVAHDSSISPPASSAPSPKFETTKPSSALVLFPPHGTGRGHLQFFSQSVVRLREDRCSCVSYFR